MADLENFGGGDFKHKTSKIQMSSPKLRVIFRPKSEIQTFFRPQSGGLQKKKEQKKKVFTEIESDFSAEIGNSNVFFPHNQVVSKKKKKKKKRSSPKLRVIFRPKSEFQTFFSPTIRWSPKKKKVFTEIESDFSAEIGISNFFSPKIRWSPKKGLHRN